MNATELKLYLFARGLLISEAAKRAWRELYPGPLTLGEYASTSGVCIVAPGDIYINAPISESFTQQSEATLVYDGGFAVEWNGRRFSVSPIPVPSFHNKMYTGVGGPLDYTELGVTHTDRIRISPIGGCAWHCRFCDSQFTSYSMKPLAGLEEVIRVASNDPLVPARHALISGGTPKPDDQGWLENVYKVVAANSPMPVDVMVAAWDDLSLPYRLKDWGVNALSVNIEIFDENRAQAITPEKAQRSRLHYLRFIEEAVNAFGIGFVQSLLVVGQAIDPLESTLRGVRALVERGCMPVLSPFRPSPKTPLRDELPVSYDWMRRLYYESLTICERAASGVKLGPRCVPCMHNTVTFPDETDWYIPLGRNLAQRPTA